MARVYRQRECTMRNLHGNVDFFLATVAGLLSWVLTMALKMVVSAVIY